MANDRAAETEDLPTLLLRFLGDTSARGDRPTLWLPTAQGAHEIPISSVAARLFVAALAPAELDPRSHVAGHPVRGTQEVLDRMGYEHRSAVTRAFQELDEPLRRVGLDAAHYFSRGRNRWGFQDVRVDIVEVLGAADDPDRLDHVLEEWSYEPRGLGLAPSNSRFFGHTLRARLGVILADADARRTQSDPPERPSRSAFAGSAPNRSGTPEREPAPARPSPPWRMAAVAGSVLVVVAVLAVILLSGSGGSTPPTATTPDTRSETTGGPAHTVENPSNAGGGFGKMLQGGETVAISCRVPGFKVQDGDTWWYRIASAPWSHRFYATADAFYNNGHRTGPLAHTPKVDPRVKLCARSA